MSPKVFSITSTSNERRVGDDLHRDAVDEPVAQLDVGVVGGELRHDPPPHPRRVEDVRLVDREQPARAAARELERAPGDPLDLVGVVLARVEDRAVVAHAARAEVESADELADDQEVDALADAGP